MADTGVGDMNMTNNKTLAGDTMTNIKWHDKLRYAFGCRAEYRGVDLLVVWSRHGNKVSFLGRDRRTTDSRNQAEARASLSVLLRDVRRAIDIHLDGLLAVYGADGHVVARVPAGWSAEQVLDLTGLRWVELRPGAGWFSD